MKLDLVEPINTSWLAGKAEVMRLASEGRTVVMKPAGYHCEFQQCAKPRWDWSNETYGIIKQATNDPDSDDNQANKEGLQARGLLTIVPSQPDEKTGLVLTRGTEVLLDGKKVSGVTKLVLTAEPNDVWRARVECFVNLTTMPGMLVEIENAKPLSWWRKMLLRMAGAAIETTDLSNRESRTYETP